MDKECRKWGSGSWRSDRGFNEGLRLCLLILCLLTPFEAACRAQMVTGEGMAEFSQTFGLSKSSAADYGATLIRSSAPGNILWPGDRPAVTFQITGSRAIQAEGHVEVIPYSTRGAPGDIWTPHLFRTGPPLSLPVSVRLAAGGFQDVTLTLPVPARFGGYALVLDMGPHGCRFLTSFVRTFSVEAKRIQYPHFCLDNLPLPVLQRLGVHAIRWGVGYKHTTESDYQLPETWQGRSGGIGGP